MSVLPVVFPSNRTLCWRSLTVDLDDQVIAVRGRSVPASPAEVGLLRTMLRHRTLPLSKLALLDGIFGPDHGRDPRQVDVFVFRLNRSLAAAGLDGAVVAVPGRGYALADEGAGEWMPMCPTRRAEPVPIAA